jgi:hypothetical protein
MLGLKKVESDCSLNAAPAPEPPAPKLRDHPFLKGWLEAGRIYWGLLVICCCRSF